MLTELRLCWVAINALQGTDRNWDCRFVARRMRWERQWWAGNEPGGTARGASTASSSASP